MPQLFALLKLSGLVLLPMALGATMAMHTSNTTTSHQQHWLAHCAEVLSDRHGMDPTSATDACRDLSHMSPRVYTPTTHPQHTDTPLTSSRDPKELAHRHSSVRGEGMSSRVRVRRVLKKQGENGFENFKGGWEGYINLLVAALCVLCAAVASGLTLGLMSVDPLELEIKQKCGTPDEMRQASRILPLVAKHHLLLVTLLLSNSAANEALPVFLDNLVPTWVAVLLSVTMVLFFGEIIPSAVFSGPNQLALASRLSGFVWVLMVLLSPIAYPIAWMLDVCLGSHTSNKRYNRAELMAMIEIHEEVKRRQMSGMPAGGNNSRSSLKVSEQTETRTQVKLVNATDSKQPLIEAAGVHHTPSASSEEDAALSHEEVEILLGALKASSKTVSDCYVPMEQVFCLSTDDILDERTLGMIMCAGYSRMPVYHGQSKTHIRGFLMAKRLIGVDPRKQAPVGVLPLRTPIVASLECPLIELLSAFQQGKSHLAIVSRDPNRALRNITAGSDLEGDARAVGIITLEDVIEEILQEEIMDEDDRSRSKRRIGSRQMISASLVLRRHQSSLLARQHPPPSLSSASSVAVPPPQDDRPFSVVTEPSQLSTFTINPTSYASEPGGRLPHLAIANSAFYDRMSMLSSPSAKKGKDQFTANRSSSSPFRAIGNTPPPAVLANNRGDGLRSPIPTDEAEPNDRDGLSEPLLKSGMR